MHIIVVGVDHTTASIALRERIACSTRQIPQVLQTTRQIASEAVLLSTCNRVELYAICANAKQGAMDLLQVLCETGELTVDELTPHSFTLADEQTVEHLFSVASGLHSLVPGEAQIQGQVVEALKVAQGGSYAGPILSALFRAAVSTGKRSRSETNISRNAASISHVAVQLARRLCAQFHSATILLVGSGKMSELAARNLLANGAQQLIIINRTAEHADALAQALNTQSSGSSALHATHRTFAELASSLAEVDVVISSTRASHTIITIELMRQVMEQRAGRPLLLIDIALPRDIDPAVATLSGVYLYNLDDLQAEVERGIHLRMQEVEHVQAIVAEETHAFQRWLASLSVVDTISDLRQHADVMRQQELTRVLRQLSPSLSERELASVQELTTRLMNKLLHTPTLRLKEAAAAGQGHMYAEALRYLFGLEGHVDETHYTRNASEQARYDTDTLGCCATTSAAAQS